MTTWHYQWRLDRGLPELGEHSKTKHAVYREYLKRYLRELTKSTAPSRFRINVIDGFAGGGVYAADRGGAPYFGSPVILLETLQEMQAELQARRREPFLLDYRVHLVEQDVGAHEVLRRTLTERGHGSLLGERVFLHNAGFAATLPALLADVDGRGRTIFILDQFGYSDVPFDLLGQIFGRLTKPEVILTFAYDHLATWVQDYERLRACFGRLGIGNLDREEYEAAQRHSTREFLVQHLLHRAFLQIARYFTPFFITSRKSNMAFWLVHLSMHARAWDVMTGLHWEMHNHFAHFGGPGHDMLGFDPANPPAAAQAYMFDDDARSRTLWRMQADLPRLLRGYGDGVEFRQFFADVANGAPGHSGIYRDALIGLAEYGEVEIQTATGGRKRAIASLGPTDRIMVPAQPSLLLPGRPHPLFARQPRKVSLPPS